MKRRASIADALSNPTARVRGLRTRGPFEFGYPVAVKPYRMHVSWEHFLDAMAENPNVDLAYPTTRRFDDMNDPPSTPRD